jgi:hypothetical protein
MASQLKPVAERSLAELEQTMNQLKETEAQTLRRLRQIIEGEIRLAEFIQNRKGPQR